MNDSIFCHRILANFMESRRKSRCPQKENTTSIVQLLDLRLLLRLREWNAKF
jgi:hypothetical protein